ncbi:hypothetical protein HMI54_013603 [Coelomomyces lativittatus]|nr:hypothetical protein HMI54_013603 [Coelomomyces lativittatus]
MSSFPEGGVTPPETDDLVKLDIPAAEENEECSYLENSLLLIHRTYYDFTFALGHMEYGFNPDYAEHFIADIGNMLQLFFKYGRINEINFRLLATYYVSSNSELTTTNLEYTGTYLNPKTENELSQMKQKVNDFALAMLTLWGEHNRNPPFLFENIIHPRVYLKHIRHSKAVRKHGMSFFWPSLEDNSEVNKALKGTTGVIVLITDLQVLDYYTHVIFLSHELIHLFGVDHDEAVGCGNHSGAMHEYTEMNWVKFSLCSSKNIKFGAYFQNETVSDVTNFYFENDEA